MEELAFIGEGNAVAPHQNTILCGIKTFDVVNDMGRTSWRLGYGLGRQGMTLEYSGGVWLQRQVGGVDGCTDAYGRYFPGCGPDVYVHPVYSDAEYSFGDYKTPTYCETGVHPTPSPLPTGGPTPTPGVPPPSEQPKDFRLNFINACSHLTHVQEEGGGQCRGLCDATYRWIGTLSSGERYGNTCDKDHWICASVDGVNDPWCQKLRNEAPTNWEARNELDQHLKTYELCGANEHYVPDGVDIFVNGPHESVRKHSNNPYQHWIIAPCDTTLNIYGCAPPNARLEDGRLVPGMPGCGGEKQVRFLGH